MLAVPSATTVPPTLSVKAFDVPTTFSTHTSVHTVPFTVAPAAGLVMKTRGSDGTRVAMKASPEPPYAA